MNNEPRLSVIVPAFNEEATIALCLERLLEQPFVAEVFVVNDGSTDQTEEIVGSFNDTRLHLLSHQVNRGKGASIRTAAPKCSAKFIAIQDADLEYDPVDLGRMLEPLDNGDADVVFGSRFLPSGARRALYFWHTLGNKALTLACNMVSNLNLTDMETCYKMFRREALQSLVLEENRFGIEPELTIKSAASGFTIYEVGVSYRGRTYAEGKKIGWRDGFSAARCIVAYGASESLRRKRSRKMKENIAVFPELHSSLEDLVDVDNYYDWILELMAPYLGDEVLEVGAGIGTISKRLSSQGRAVTAVEPSLAAYEQLKIWAKDAPTNEARLGTLSENVGGLKKNFTSVILVNVLEHIQDEVADMRLIWGCLEPGGHVAIWVPAHESLYAPFDASVGHFRRYSKRRLKALADSAGFEVVQLKYVNPMGAVGWLLTAKILRQRPTQSVMTRIFDKFVVPLTRELEARWTPAFGQSVLLVARKPSQA